MVTQIDRICGSGQVEQCEQNEEDGAAGSEDDGPQPETAALPEIAEDQHQHQQDPDKEQQAAHDAHDLHMRERLPPAADVTIEGEVEGAQGKAVRRRVHRRIVALEHDSDGRDVHSQRHQQERQTVTAAQRKAEQQDCRRRQDQNAQRHARTASF